MGLDTGNGKICYLEMPAKEIEVSAAFYRDVFDWKIRIRGDGNVAFDDGVGQVSGTWITTREPMPPGIGIYIMVDDAIATLGKITMHGGEVVQGIGAHYPKITAQFRDPAGNILGIYQEPRREEPS